MAEGKQISPLDTISGQRLESWKDIAAYLKRDVRTVQRWEKRESLPVYRHMHEKLGTVYAYKGELDEWWRSGQERIETLEQTSGVKMGVPELAAAQPTKLRSTNSWVALGMLLLVAAVIVTGLVRRQHTPAKISSRLVSSLTTLPGAEFAPAFSPDGKRVLFAWTGSEGNGYDLYAKSLDSGEVHRLTWHHSSAVWPAWSSNGKEIAFLRRDDAESGIFIMPATGGPERKLVQVECDPDYQWQSLNWSSNGYWLAYSEKYRGGESYRIVVFSVKDLQRRVLTTPPLGSQDVFPDFSPDGQRVAFYRCVHADCRIHTVGTQGGDPSPIHPGTEVVDGELVWTHDGRSIIAAIRRQNAHQLWRFPLKAGNPELMYSSPVDQIMHLAMSPDGKTLVFSALHYIENIWRLDLSGSGGRLGPPVKFIASSRGQEFPQYSLDGKKIAFHSNWSGTWEVWVCDADGTHPLQLTQTERGNSTYPRWSPDGRDIAYDTRQGGRSSIFLISAEGGTPQPVDTEDLEAEVPSFSPDGQWIYFAGRREKNWQIWRVPRAGGAAVQVTQDGGYAPVISVDNKWAYYTKSYGLSGIWRVPVSGGVEELLIPELEARFYADWALVPTGIYFLNTRSEPEPSIQFLDLASRNRLSILPLSTVHSWSDGMAVSPDGRWLLFPRVEKPESDLMLLKDFGM